ncbi:hypothetical protein M9H77_08767 [Catharanthus roseus]|uniref:Uncharacterized protein n=1 Tax=Catharanthus roseus TaxID=4058 RepID=A0ACC0BYZ8_CATRO|nr:hypothetical protein M9H77_08767 [Catharanthus roseus]
MHPHFFLESLLLHGQISIVLFQFRPVTSSFLGCIPATKNPLDGKFSSIPRSLVDKIYRIQGGLELSFFRVIVIIRFRLTRNDIISVRSVNLIVIIINVTVQHRRFITAVICSGKVVRFGNWKRMARMLREIMDCRWKEGKVIGGMNYCPLTSWAHGMSYFDVFATKLLSWKRAVAELL